MRTEDGKMHHMILRNEYEGTEEWYCPICGRRLLVNWQPTFEKKVLEIGDEYAIHSGGKSGLQTGVAKIMPEQPGTLNDDIWLAPWVKWLEDVGFENLWNNDI